MHLRLKGNVLAFPEKVVRGNLKEDGKIAWKNEWKTCISH